MATTTCSVTSPTTRTTRCIIDAPIPVLPCRRAAWRSEAGIMVKFVRVLGVGIGLTVVACGGGGGGSTTGGGGDTTTGGDTSSQYAGPIGSTDVAQGEARYNAVCASCHNNGAPAVANIGWTTERLRQQIREGSANMPAIHEARLSDADMEAVLAYMNTIGSVASDSAQPAAAPQ
jgi:cytochrome c5